MARGPAKEKAIALAPATAAHGNNEVEELVRKRDAFVTSMTMLRNAAEEASTASLTYFNHVIGVAANGDHTHPYQRGMSMPARGMTEEPETGKRIRRKREKRDPDLPKRPMTAYLLFCNHGRETVKRELPAGATHKDIIAELTLRWSNVPDEEKKAWQDLYLVNRAVYEKNLAEYKAAKLLKAAANIAPAVAPATIPATAPAGGFTAVNHTETAEESEVESEAELEDEPAPVNTHVPISAPAPAPAPPAPAPAAAIAADPEPESELSEAEEVEEEEEDEKSPSPPPKSPTPPPRVKATPRGKKAAANGTKKASVPIPVENPPKEEKRKRTSSRKKAAAEEEAVVAEETPKKRAKKRRKSSGD